MSTRGRVPEPGGADSSTAESVAPIIPIRSAAEQVARRKSRLETMGIPLVHVLQLLEPGRIDSTMAVQAAARYLEERNKYPWLLLCGHKGVGKTLALGWLLMKLDEKDPEMARKQGAVKWITNIEVGQEAPWSKSLAEWSRAGLLVVDDLHAGFVDSTGQYNTKVEALALPRYDRLASLLVTTNLNLPELQRYYPRVADRFSEVGRVVEIAGPSLRGKKL